MLRRLSIVSLFVAGALFGVAASQAAQSDHSTLPGSAPAWANAQNRVGTADPSGAVGFRVYLRWQNESAAVALANAVSDPRSPSYGRYLTPARFRQQFAPSQGQVGAVQAWLRSQGFSIVHTPMNNHYVSAEGTVAQAEAAFGTQFGMYKVNGKTVRSPAASVSIPSALTNTVEGVIGLDDGADFVEPNNVIDNNAPPSAGFRNSPPLSTYWSEFVSPYAYPSGFTDRTVPPTAPWTVRGYTPAQIKGTYNITGYDGAGQTVAVIDAYASPTIRADVNQWSANRGLPTMSPSQFIEVVPPGIYKRPQNPQQDPQSWYGEETLDIEAVHGIAPAAKIVYVGAPNNRRDLDAAMNHVVDRHLADIVTNSYGYATELLPPGYIKPLEDTFVQAVIEGIGIYFSSGDNGDESSRFGFATTDYPASSPWVTAVGGTALAVGQNNARVFETGWGTSNYACNTTTLACTRSGWLYSSGGGVSQIFAKPSYQSALSGAGRHVPDVAALGDPQTGMIVGQTQTFPNGPSYDEFRLGGTSLSVQTFGALMALANQKNGSPLGFANPALYANAGQFFDVTSVKTAVARRNYNNNVDATAGTSDFLRTFDDYSGSPTQHTGPGWDNVTGLGTPNGIFTP